MQGAFCCRSVSQGPDFKKRSFSWRKILSWSMIDFSNSLVIMIVTQIYPAFLQNFAFTNPIEGVNKISTVNITNSAICLVLSPILGVFSDYYYLRLPFLGISALGYGGFTCLLYLVKDASWRNFAIAMFFFIVLMFRINETFVSSFMPSLCNDRDMGFVSGLGFCIGFLSGTIVLAIVNMLTPLRVSGFTVNGLPIIDVPRSYMDRQIAMLITGIIMLLSILAPLLMLDNGIPPGEKRPKFKWKVFGDAFVTLGSTFKSGFSVNKHVTMLLLTYFLFFIGINSGSSVLVQVFTQEGKPHGFNMQTLTTSMTVYNIMVAFTSISYGILAKYTGAKPLLILSIVAMMLNTTNNLSWKQLAPLFGVPEPVWAHYWIWVSTVLSSFGLGPIQALLRGVVGVLAPAEKKCEIFGIMEMFQLIAWLIGAISGQQLFRHGYLAYFGYVICWYFLTFIFICLMPIGKAEKEARQKNAKYGNATIDEIRQIEIKLAMEEQLVEEARIIDDEKYSTTTTTPHHSGGEVPELSTQPMSPPLHD